MLMTDRAGLRQAGARLLQRGPADRRRPVGRRPLLRLHDVAARGVRRRAGHPDRRRRRRRGDRADAGRQATPSSSCATRSPSAAPATHVVADAHTFGPADSPRDRGGGQDHEAAGRSHDLVLLGNDAADSGDFQVGIRLAYELGRPVVNGASTVTIDGRPDGRSRAVGKGPDGHETYRVPLPAVITDPGGRRRAALPQRDGPDEGQEGRGRGAHARRRAARAATGSSCRCRRRHPAACRSWARAPRPRRPWSTCSSSWGCCRDDPRACGDRPRRHRLRGLAARPSPSPATCPPRAVAFPSTP